jgi:hypothetical protein
LTKGTPTAKCVLHPARYIDETETVEFGEVHVFAGPQFVITVRHGQAPDLAAVRRGLEARPDLLRRGPVAILHAIMDRVVDDYAPVVAGVENDIDEIEDEVFEAGVRAHVSRRIYQLTREVIAFQRAIKPLVVMLERLIAAPGVEDEEGRYLRDVHDHALRVQEQADGFRELLQNILSVNLTLETKTLSEVSNEQNDQVKKISAGGDPVRALDGRDGLRHELRAHARAALAARLCLRARAHGGGVRGAVPALQAPPLDLNPGRREPFGRRRQGLHLPRRRPRRRPPPPRGLRRPAAADSAARPSLASARWTVPRRRPRGDESHGRTEGCGPRVERRGGRRRAKEPAAGSRLVSHVTCGC